MAKTINILGDMTQAEQWKMVVNILRVTGGDMDYRGRDSICGELDRYIDFAEKTMHELSAECERLEEIIKSYGRMIDNDKGKNPAAVLSDIRASVRHVEEEV